MTVDPLSGDGRRRNVMLGRGKIFAVLHRGEEAGLLTHDLSLANVRTTKGNGCGIRKDSRPDGHDDEGAYMALPWFCHGYHGNRLPMIPELCRSNVVREQYYETSLRVSAGLVGKGCSGLNLLSFLGDRTVAA